MTEEQSFQARVEPWLHACFGPEIAADKIERNHRLLEEALETVQAGGCTRSEAHQLVDYVFSRPVGEIEQEVGGLMNTLAAFCLAHGLDMHEAGETELVRVWTKCPEIRAKQAAKPKHSPLPGSADESSAEDTVRLDFLDQCNTRMNHKNGTFYGWSLEWNHNRVALADCCPMQADVREAIDRVRKRSDGRSLPKPDRRHETDLDATALAGAVARINNLLWRHYHSGEGKRFVCTWRSNDETQPPRVEIEIVKRAGDDA